MRRLFIALITLVLSWLPTTASAIFIQYDIEFKAILSSPELYNLVEPIDDFDGEAIKKTFDGTAIAYFDGQTRIENSLEAFSLPLSFILDVDGTRLSGNGAINFYVTDTYITMNFDDGSITVDTEDEIYSQEFRDENGDPYAELTALPMDIGYIINYFGSNYPPGAQSIIDTVSLDPRLDRTRVTLEGAWIRLSNGREIPAVPVPAAVWLFSSGLIGLIGIARRKKADLYKR